MGAWEELQPVAVDTSSLPAKWNLILDPDTGHYAVVGRSGLAAVDVVIRVDYAVGADGEDNRHMVGSAVVLGMEAVRRGLPDPGG